MFMGNKPERSEIFIIIFSGLSLVCRSSEKLTRFKIAADNLMAFAGEFFTKEMKTQRHRVVKMLFKSKSVLYPGRNSNNLNQRR